MQAQPGVTARHSVVSPISLRFRGMVQNAPSGPRAFFFAVALPLIPSPAATQELHFAARDRSASFAVLADGRVRAAVRRTVN